MKKNILLILLIVGYGILLAYFLFIGIDPTIIGAYIPSGLTLVLFILDRYFFESKQTKDIKLKANIDDLKEEKDFYGKLAYHANEILDDPRAKIRLTNNFHVGEITKLMSEKPNLIDKKIKDLRKKCGRHFAFGDSSVNRDVEIFLNEIIERSNSTDERYNKLVI